MATIAKGLKKMFKSKKFDPKKFYKKGSSSSKNEKFSKGTKLINNKNDSNLGPCFGCGLPGHIVKYCPVLQMKDEKHKHKAKREFRKAMIAAWSDSDSSDSDKEEEMANLCLMANDVHETESENLDEVDHSDLLEYWKDELAQALIQCIRCEQEYLSKIKSLKKTIRNLLFEKEALQKLNSESLSKIEMLENEKKEL